MSASQQKKLRQQQREQGVEKRQLAEQEAAKKQKKASIITTVVWAAVVLALVFVVLFSSNLFYHAFPAVTIGDTSYNASELSFMYKQSYYTFVQQSGDYLQYLGLDTTQPLESQQYGENQTWADYFMESAITNLTEITAMCDAAAAEGFELPAEKQASIDAELANLDATAKSANFASAKAYLAANYGKGCNEKIVRNLIERSALADAYAQKMYESYSYTDSELTAQYDDNKDKYDNFTYISYFAEASADDEAGIDAETAKANAKELASSIVDGVSTEEEFKQSVLAHTETEANSSTIQGSSISSAYSEWMLDASRKAGDMTVVESDTGCYALYFISREKNDAETVTARHILTYVLPDENGDYTDDAKAEAKAKAEDILATWKAGDATEESFALLANANSDDTGSNTNGGLYENFKQGSMVEEFDAWCFDPARKAGDTGIVFNEGSYCGYHVIYFVGKGESYDKVLAESDLRSTDYSDWKTAATGSYSAGTTLLAKLV